MTTKARRWKRDERTAVHEAGHAVAYMLTGRRIHGLAIERRMIGSVPTLGHANLPRLVLPGHATADDGQRAAADALHMLCGGEAERVRGATKRPMPRGFLSDRLWRTFTKPEGLTIATMATARWSDGHDVMVLLEFVAELVKAGAVTEPVAWLQARELQAQAVMERPDVAAHVDRVAEALRKAKHLDHNDPVFAGIVALGQALALDPNHAAQRSSLPSGPGSAS